MQQIKPKLLRNDILYPELSYKVTGLCLEVKKELGRFAKEKQYSDRLEQKFKDNVIKYSREFSVEGTGNRVDFIVEDIILLEIKARPFINKEDYFQTQRYLKILNLKLGLLINFQNIYLKAQRIINFQN
ncbi:MAG: GxxExxY protein [Candidatus Doudnabacteria bacterium]|jgi:GxxExxY protein